MMEAFALAGELCVAGNDPEMAFRNYERRLRPLVERKQKSAASFAATFVPGSKLGVWVRNPATKLMNIRGVGRLLLGRTLRVDFELPG